MRQIFPSILFLLFLAGCMTAPTKLPQVHSVNKENVLTPGQIGKQVPKNFLGFSIELSDLCTIILNDEKEGVTYEHLFTNLGKGTLRIGGHSADISHWSSSGTASCNPDEEVNPLLLKSLFLFAKSIHWQVSWTLPLIPNDPHMAASEAVAVEQSGGSSLISFSIGNEPELYSRRHERSPSWTYEDYRNEWEQVYTEVVVALPHATFEGPDICCQGPFFMNFLNDEQGYIALATHHYYTRSVYGEPELPTATELLSENVDQKFIDEASGWLKLASAEGLPLAITESNTISGGGYQGVSDTFAATLWGIDTMMEAAVMGIQQFDIQEAPGTFYNAIGDNGKPQAMYHAIDFVHLALPPGTIVPITIAWPILGFAVQGCDGYTHITLINNSFTRSITIAINPGKNIPSLHAQRLFADSIATTQAIALKKVPIIEQSGVIHAILPPGSAENILF